MKRTYTTYDEAVKIYTARTGEVPTIDRMNDLYHKYRQCWKHFSGFENWLENYTE